MDKVKSAVGLGKSDKEEGEEPVSGETGEGTTAEPFDAGNKQAQGRYLLTSCAQAPPLESLHTSLQRHFIIPHATQSTH